MLQQALANIGLTAYCNIFLLAGFLCFPFILRFCEPQKLLVASTLIHCPHYYEMIEISGSIVNFSIIAHQMHSTHRDKVCRNINLNIHKLIDMIPQKETQHKNNFTDTRSAFRFKMSAITH